MKIELTAEDRALDVRKEYEDTRVAIELLKNSRLEVPEEAGVILSLLKRCIVAEETIATEPDLAGYLGMSELLRVAANLFGIYKFAGPAYGEAVEKWLAMYDALQSPPVTASPEATAPPSSSL